MTDRQVAERALRETPAGQVALFIREERHLRRELDARAQTDKGAAQIAADLAAQGWNVVLVTTTREVRYYAHAFAGQDERYRRPCPRCAHFAMGPRAAKSCRACFKPTKEQLRNAGAATQAHWDRKASGVGE